MAAAAVETQAAAPANQEIDTMIVQPPGPLERPSPVCSQCKAKTVKVASSSTATVTFTFIGEGNEGFDGGAEFWVKLLDGTFVSTHWVALEIDHGETRSFDLVEKNFSWSNVETVLLELAPS